MSEITPFDFRGQKVRVVTIDGSPWFASPDVCRSLGMDLGRGTYEWLTSLRDDERQLARRKDLPELFSGTSAPSLTLISESGLYKLVMRSDKPEARQFQDWVTRDVLPAIQHSEASRLTRTNFHPLAEVAGG